MTNQETPQVESEEQPKKKSRRGFASMPKDRLTEICRKGGQSAHRMGTAHKFTPEEARLAGMKGGKAISKSREHMSVIGQKGGKARHGAK